MRTDLAGDPEVVALSSRLRRDIDATVGLLHAFWSWADAHTADGDVPHVTGDWVDWNVRQPGFSAAMAAVGWLTISAQGVVIPNFTRWNGNSAKKRLQNSSRQKALRERDICSAPSATTEQTDRQEEKKKNLSGQTGSSLAQPVCLSAEPEEALIDFLKRANVREPSRSAMLALDGLTAAEFSTALRDACGDSKVTNPIGVAIASVFSSRGVRPPKGKSSGSLSVDPHVRELARLRGAKNGQVTR